MKKGDTNSNILRSSDRPKSTFIVKVEYCQNGTWQGKVIWAEENRTLRFRSALELFRLMEEAMTSESQISLGQQQERTGS